MGEAPRFRPSGALPLSLLLCAVAFPGATGALAQPPGPWQAMLDEPSLGAWKHTPFTGHGEVSIAEGVVRLGAGTGPGTMTGITWTGPFPTTNFEVRFEAARLEGSDFFATLTFPVRDAFCSWVTGGWGGDIVGLSSVDGWDASDNETRSYYQFEQGRWYRFLLRVTDEMIQTWIDDQPVTRLPLRGRRISLRPGEIQLSAPFGFAAYSTTGGIRKIEYRILK